LQQLQTTLPSSGRTYALAGEVISADEAAKRCDEYEEQQIKHMYLFQTRYSMQLLVLPAQTQAASLTL